MYLSFSRHDARSFSRRKFFGSMKTCHSLQTAAEEAQPRCFWREVSSRIIQRISTGNEAQELPVLAFLALRSIRPQETLSPSLVDMSRSRLAAGNCSSKEGESFEQGEGIKRGNNHCLQIKTQECPKMVGERSKQEGSASNGAPKWRVSV